MSDQLTAAIKVQAMLTTIRTKDDPAEAFFDRLPTLEEYHSVTSLRAHEEMGQRLGTVLNTLDFFCRKYGQNSKDPDFDYIIDFVIKGSLNVPAGFLAPMGNSMAFLALKKSRNGELSGQRTKKDQTLAYYLWRLHGFKDETSPISAQKPIKNKAFEAPSHDFLPSSRTTRGPCSNCGHADAGSWCSGCRITKSGKVVFAVFYCDRGCMKAHWKVHKSACKEVRAVRRAATIFTELWFEYLQVTDYRDIEDVIEEDGLIEIVGGSIYRRAFLGEGLFREFPRHLVDSEEQALACMAVKTCEDIAKEGRILFELVMRPSCAVVEAVRVQPKNAHKTVHLSYPEDRHEFPFMYFHLVFRLTLPSGLSFAFDPTGAQNGWQEYLAPWDAYARHRIHFIKNIRTLDAWGPERRMSETEQERLSTGDLLGEMKLGQQSRLAFMAVTVEGFMSRELADIGMEELLHRIPDDRFEAFRVMFVKTAVESLRRYKRMIDEGPTERLYHAPDYQIYMTQSSEQFRSLQKAWFTEAEYKELLGDGLDCSKLNTAWAVRLEKMLMERQTKKSS